LQVFILILILVGGTTTGITTTETDTTINKMIEMNHGAILIIGVEPPAATATLTLAAHQIHFIC
jgi:hypothetical protein